METRDLAALMFTVIICILITIYVVITCVRDLKVIFKTRQINEQRLGFQTDQKNTKIKPTNNNKNNSGTNAAIIGIGAVGIASLIGAAYLLKSIREESKINYNRDNNGERSGSNNESVIVIF